MTTANECEASALITVDLKPGSDGQSSPNKVCAQGGIMKLFYTVDNRALELVFSNVRSRSTWYSIAILIERAIAL